MILHIMVREHRYRKMTLLLLFFWNLLSKFEGVYAHVYAYVFLSKMGRFPKEEMELKGENV